jgi:hypothetical protein
VDSIQYYSQRVAELTEEIESLQKNSDLQPTAVGFVTFTNQVGDGFLYMYLFLCMCTCVTRILVVSQLRAYRFSLRRSALHWSPRRS